ncbi:putative lipoprotein [Streptomyces fumigatiscleroticus]|nr:putative lipoprotein [Streptomyces fumigatiscleroticus]
MDKADTIMAALSRATDRTEELGSARIDMTTELGTAAPVSMEGTYSWGDGYAFDVEMDTEAAQMQQLTDAPTIRTLFVDGAYYYDVDPQPSGPLKGKEWMKVDGSAVFGEQGAEAFSGGAGAGSPTASMKSLKYASDVEDLGEEKVGGKSTAHYRAVVDSEDLGRFKDAYSSEESLLNSVVGGTDSITMDVWVGSDDLPVRMRQVMGNATVTMDFAEFGATKEIQAPPAAQTGDLTEVLKRATAEQQG